MISTYENIVGIKIINCEVNDSLIFKNCTRVFIENCEFYNLSSPIQLRGCTEVNILSCKFYECSGHNIQTSEGEVTSDLTIQDCDFKPKDLPWVSGVNDGASGDVIALRNTYRAILSDNKIFNSGENGITISKGCQNVIARSNSIIRADGPGIQLGSIGDPVRNIVLDSNIIVDWGVGREVNDNQPAIRCHLANGVSISNNILARGNYFADTSYGILARDTDTLNIKNNVILGTTIPFRIPKVLWDTVTDLTSDIEPRWS